MILRKINFDIFRHIRHNIDDNDLIFWYILRIKLVYTENWRNGGGDAATAENPPTAAEFVLPFLAELDNSESFEINFFFGKNFP